MRLAGWTLLIASGWAVTTCTITAGQVSGTVNAIYSRSTREAVVNEADSVISPETSTEAKQSNVRINYQDVLFSKNLMRLGANYFIQRDEIAGRWDVRPIYNFDLSSAGYTYNGSYSPRKQTSRLRIPNGTYVETRTYFRDWRNSLTVRYKRYPVVTGTYNISRGFDDLPVRKIDHRSRYASAQTAYFVGPATVNVIYTNSQNEDSRLKPITKANKRTWQGNAAFAGTAPAVGSFSASYSYLDARAATQAAATPPITASHIHVVSAMVTSREVFKMSATASYSGRFLNTRSADAGSKIKDESFSGQLAFAPLTYFTLTVTKNYQIASPKPGAYQVSEYLSLSSAFSRCLRRGWDTRLNWTRTYVQKVVQGNERIAGNDNYSDALYMSLAAIPYHRSKLLADMSITRANRPQEQTPRYQSARSLSLSVSATRHLDARLSVTYANQGSSINLFSSSARNLSAGVTYLPGSSLNCNLTYTRNDVNTTPRYSNRAMSGYLGYSFRNTYTLYLYMNRQRQESPGGATATESIVRSPRSTTGQLQIRLSPGSTLSASYSTSTAFAGNIPVGDASTLQIVYHGQF